MRACTWPRLALVRPCGAVGKRRRGLQQDRGSRGGKGIRGNSHAATSWVGPAQAPAQAGTPTSSAPAAAPATAAPAARRHHTQHHTPAASAGCEGTLAAPAWGRAGAGPASASCWSPPCRPPGPSEKGRAAGRRGAVVSQRRRAGRNAASQAGAGRLDAASEHANAFSDPSGDRGQPPFASLARQDPSLPPHTPPLPAPPSIHGSHHFHKVNLGGAAPLARHQPELGAVKSGRVWAGGDGLLGGARVAAAARVVRKGPHAGGGLGPPGPPQVAHQPQRGPAWGTQHMHGSGRCSAGNWRQPGGQREPAACGPHNQAAHTLQASKQARKQGGLTRCLYMCVCDGQSSKAHQNPDTTSSPGSCRRASR